MKRKGKIKEPKRKRAKQYKQDGKFYLDTSFESAIQVLAGSKNPKKGTVKPVVE